MVHTGRVHSHRSTVRTVQLRVGRHRCAKEPGNKPNSEAEGKYDVRRGVPAASDRASRGFFFVCSGERPSRLVSCVLVSSSLTSAERPGTRVTGYSCNLYPLVVLRESLPAFRF